jgi:aspartyl-tRNA(Asn)/glutamyl-tRNA(Gln) amidotransferase subunit C
MKVSAEDVVYVADLANLELTEGERARMLQDLNSILDYVERLNELDTAGVEPMAQTSDRYQATPTPEPGEAGALSAPGGAPSFAYTLRADAVHALRPSLPREAALRNAPQTDGAFFKVPRVIER